MPVRRHAAVVYRRRRLTVAGMAALLVGVVAWAASGSPDHATRPAAVGQSAGTSPSAPPAVSSAHVSGHAVGPLNIYAADGANMLSPTVRGDRHLVYVPNSESDTVDVVDQATDKIVDHFAVGHNPQHVVPAWDLKTLYVTNDLGNSLTPVNPLTGKVAGPVIPVDDPYNLYFTPDGRFSIVVAEQRQHLDFRDPHTFALRNRVAVACPGVDHIDFAADQTYLLATCEFSGKLVKVDLKTQTVAGYLTLRPSAMPQDIKLDPAGKVFYVADMASNGVWEVDGATLKVLTFLPTGAGAHGLYPSRDAKDLYVSNRGEGSVSVLDFATRRLVAKWRIPGGGSPDMGGVSADGTVLWLTGRYNGVVYAISTRDGHLVAKLPVGSGPHGACVWPQPGRFSLGHTGILR